MSIAFLHTSPLHIATFDRLLAELAPGVAARHTVDEALLRDARDHGLSEALAVRVARAVGEAAHGAAVLVCTCSTIGACAEEAGARAGRTVVRVDRAMAERAVALGRRVALVATSESTIAPTRALLLEAAARAGAAPTISATLCADAWPLFERGDMEGYHAAVAACARAAARQADVVVLAQASMAPAAGLCADMATPVLSSPRLGLEAALRVLAQGSAVVGREPEGIEG